MTELEIGEALLELQELFNIHPQARIDFRTEAGELHSRRILHAFRKSGITADISSLSSLYERIEKTPKSGSQMVDAIIEQIHEAARGELVEPATPAPEVWRGDTRYESPLSEAELARIAPQLARMGIDPRAPVDVQRSQFRKWVLGHKERLGRELAKGAKPEPARRPPSREQAEAALRAVRHQAPAGFNA